MLRKLSIAIAAGAVVALSGCATLLGTDAAASAAIQGGIEIVTTVYIQHKGNNNATSEAIVASQVQGVAVTLQGIVKGNLTVAQFNAQIKQYLANLSPVQQVIANELLVQLDLYFAQQLASGTLISATTQAAANIVLNDVIAACQPFLPVTAKPAA